MDSVGLTLAFYLLAPGNLRTSQNCGQRNLGGIVLRCYANAFLMFRNRSTSNLSHEQGTIQLAAGCPVSADRSENHLALAVRREQANRHGACDQIRHELALLVLIYKPQEHYITWRSGKDRKNQLRCH